MFITKTPSRKPSGKVYYTRLLRQSYRENGKVKKRTLANLTDWPESAVTILEQAIRNSRNSKSPCGEDFKITQGLSFGAPYVLYQLAERLGLIEALGNDFQGKLAIWQVIARVLEQGSRLSATRLAQIYDLASVINLPRGFDENDLYDNLSWLSERQNEIEDFLFRKRNKNVSLFLYDVTSSYFEGNLNEMAEYGYNRDQKKRKKQIVIGLLCDEEGTPVSVEVFQGNTQDVETFISQIQKTQERFSSKRVTFVGDRGMIKKEQIEEVIEQGCQYITALTMPQMLKLFNDGILDPSQFSGTLKELVHEGTRYVYRRSTGRAAETMQSRHERLNKAQEKVDLHNARLAESVRRKPLSAKGDIKKYLKRLCIDEWVSVSVKQRTLNLVVDDKALKEKAKYDGCYVLKTSIQDPEMTPNMLFARYKDLSLVESAFRTCKTTFLEMRPIYVRKALNTRGHVLVVMLAYLLVQKLTEAWKGIDMTAKEGLTKLAGICTIDIEIGGSSDLSRSSQILSPDSISERLLAAVDIAMPTKVTRSLANVVSRKKVGKS